MNFSKTLLSISLFCLLGLHAHTEIWYEETIYPEWRQKLAIDETLVKEFTDVQEMIIFNNAFFGKVLALDGAVQTTERDEFIYSEMIAHVPLMTHSYPKRVLIVGGGDGCVLREVLKHPSVEHVDLLEIDLEVIESSKKHYPNLCLTAFNDSRTHIIIDNLQHPYLENNPSAFYDVVICDCPDPVGPAMVLYTAEFYQECYNHLNTGGIFTNLNGVPFFQSECYKKSYLIRKNIFTTTSYYYVCMPTYVGGLLSIGYSTKGHVNPDWSSIETRYRLMEPQLHYYTPGLHTASFKEPKVFTKMLENKAQ